MTVQFSIGIAHAGAGAGAGAAFARLGSTFTQLDWPPYKFISAPEGNPIIFVPINQITIQLKSLFSSTK